MVRQRRAWVKRMKRFFVSLVVVAIIAFLVGFDAGLRSMPPLEEPGNTLVARLWQRFTGCPQQGGFRFGVGISPGPILVYEIDTRKKNGD